MYKLVIPYGISLIVFVILLSFSLAPINRSLGARRGYGPGFFNDSGCMYLYMDGAEFEMLTADGKKINETLDLKALSYNATKTKCVKDKTPGKVTFSFKVDNEQVNSVLVSMRVMPVDKYGYWIVSQANMTITRNDLDLRRTFQVKVPNIYSAATYSYSCSRLELQTMYRKKQFNDTKVDPSATLTLKRFQLQPFPELKHLVFAASYDCFNWITIPELMGLILIVFMITITIIGVIPLARIVTNDFKFTKEGLMFTQSQLESTKRQ